MLKDYMCLLNIFVFFLYKTVSKVSPSPALRFLNFLLTFLDLLSIHQWNRFSISKRFSLSISMHLYPSGSTLYVANAISGNMNYGIYRTRMPLKRWSKVKVMQHGEGSRFIYRVFVDGRLVRSRSNTQPREWTDMKLYVADPWYHEQAGNIRNLVLKSECYTSCLKKKVKKWDAFFLFPV